MTFQGATFYHGCRLQEIVKSSFGLDGLVADIFCLESDLVSGGPEFHSVVVCSSWQSMLCWSGGMASRCAGGPFVVCLVLYDGTMDWQSKYCLNARTERGERVLRMYAVHTRPPKRIHVPTSKCT